MLVLLLAATPATAVEPAVAERVEQVLSEGSDAARVPGAAFVIVDGEDVTAGGVGRSGDGGEVTARTPFLIGSTTKSFTALAVMQLVDDGSVDLDDPVRRYVPELQLADEAAADRITVRHLLQQTSGLPAAASGPVLQSAREGTALEAVAELSGARLQSAPGSRWEYTNANFVLAGLVVERASGMSYADHVESRILAPLGMTRSTTSLEAARELGVTSGHQLWFGAAVERGPVLRSGIQPAGYLVSTAEDLGRYLRMYLDGGVAADGTRVVSADSLAEMTEPGPEAHLGPWADGATVRYAMGWFVGGPWDEPTLLHPGNTPDSSAMLTVLPERRLAVATTMNLSHELPVPGNPSATDRLSRNVVEAALGEQVQPETSLARFYVVFDLVALVLVAAAAWGLARAASALRSGVPSRRRALAAAGVLVRLAVAALLLLSPAAAGLGWGSVWVWAPDLGLVVALLVALLVAAAALRLLQLVREPRATPRGEPAEVSGAGTGPVTVRV